MCGLIIIFFFFFMLNCEIPSGIRGGRMEQDQATLQELKSMFSELKELLHQQVTSLRGVTPDGGTFKMI